MITQVNPVTGEAEIKTVPGQRALGEGVAQPAAEDGANDWTSPPLFRFEGAFWVSVKEDEVGKYTAYVTPGKVVDYTTMDGDAVVYHDVDNDINEYGLISIPLDPGQSVYVYYDVDKTGAVVAKSPSVVSGAFNETSEHYIPVVGSDGPGAAGNVLWKLAHFEVDGEGTILVENYGDGVNLTHHRVLSPFYKLGGTADVFVSYNPSTGRYQTRGVSGKGAITVKQLPDRIEVSSDDDYITDLVTPLIPAAVTVSERAAVPQVNVSGGPNYVVEGNGADGGITVNGGSPVVSWLDGLVTNDATVDITIPAAVTVSERASDPQINITGTPPNYVVEGNGVNGSLSIAGSTVDGFTQVMLSWVDGLIVTSGNKELTLEGDYIDFGETLALDLTFTGHTYTDAGLTCTMTVTNDGCACIMKSAVLMPADVLSCPEFPIYLAHGASTSIEVHAGEDLSTGSQSFVLDTSRGSFPATGSEPFPAPP